MTAQPASRRTHLRELLLVCMFRGAGIAQPPPPPPPPPPPGQHAPPPPPLSTAGVRRQLRSLHPAGSTENELLALAENYLKRSERDQTKNRFVSDRYLTAADAL